MFDNSVAIGLKENASLDIKNQTAFLSRNLTELLEQCKVIRDRRIPKLN